MADFFQSLSAIGDTLVKNRMRSDRERTLADIGDLFGRGALDHKALAAKLFGAGEVRAAILALRLGAMGNAGRHRWPDVVADVPASAPSAPVAPSAMKGSAVPPGMAGALDNPALRQQVDAEYGPGAFDYYFGK
jgi:hypothetical protein